jgi:hypothetical protein
VTRLRALACIALVCSTAVSGCAAYEMALAEFDRVAEWEAKTREEPAEVAYSGQSENPSSVARNTMRTLVWEMGDETLRHLQVCRRLLWVASKDPSAYNRIVALQGIEHIVAARDNDLLAEEQYVKEISGAAIEGFERRVHSAYAALRRLIGRSHRPAIRPAERVEYLAAIRDFVEQPLGRERWQRDLLSFLWAVLVSEQDPAVLEAAQAAADRAIAYAACNGLRGALVPTGVDVAELPDVRVAAIHVYRRQAGPAALPFLLRLLAQPRIGPEDQRFDRDLDVRRVLVRLCAQLRYDLAMASHAGGPRPVEFLYETAVDEGEDVGLRRVAIEGLARCLAPELGIRRIDFDLEWARRWWRGFVVGRSERG